MTNKNDFPGEFEQMVLLSILRLGNDATAIKIRGELQQTAGRAVSRGALYRTLDRMEAKSFVDWRTVEPTEERGGHARRVYVVEKAGIKTLRASREALENLWDGLGSILETGK